MSFKKAADELFVTPSAVSHAIQSLEAALQIKLFHRRGRTLLLTDAGQAYWPSVRSALLGLDEATRDVAARGAADLLTVASSPSFARVWLLPRLGRFLDREADTDLRVVSTIQPDEFSREGIDIGIIYGKGNWPGFEAEPLLTERLVPLCAPKLLSGPKRLETPADLKNHTLIHTETKATTWSAWLAAAGVSGRVGTRGLRFNRSNLSLEAAAAGLGVSMESALLASPFLADGRLVQAFPTSLDGQDAGGYFLVYRQGALAMPKVEAFRAWVFDEKPKELDLIKL